MIDEIKCRWCEYQRPLYVRLTSGKQRSGYRLIQEHAAKVHQQWQGRGFKAARVDDQCPSCDGKGCEFCEPEGPRYYDGNTGEPIRVADA